MTRVEARRVLGDWCDAQGWDWSDGAEHDPTDRLAVVSMRRLGAPRVWGVVYRGSEPDALRLFSSKIEARGAMQDWACSITQNSAGAS